MWDISYVHGKIREKLKDTTMEYFSEVDNPVDTNAFIKECSVFYLSVLETFQTKETSFIMPRQ